MKTYVQLLPNTVQIKRYMVDLYLSQPGMYELDKNNATLKNKDHTIIYVTPDNVDKIRGISIKGFSKHGDWLDYKDHEKYDRAIDIIMSHIR